MGAEGASMRTGQPRGEGGGHPSRREAGGVEAGGQGGAEAAQGRGRTYGEWQSRPQAEED